MLSDSLPQGSVTSIKPSCAPRGSLQPAGAMEATEPPALTWLPSLRTASRRKRQPAKIPGSRSIRQIISCKLLLKAEIRAGPRKFTGVCNLLVFSRLDTSEGRLLIRGRGMLWKPWPP